MNKKQIIYKIVNDLPTSDMRGELTKEEWYAWFEECWEQAINYTSCCTDVCECEVPNVASKLICNKCDKDFK